MLLGVLHGIVISVLDLKFSDMATRLFLASLAYSYFLLSLLFPLSTSEHLNNHSFQRLTFDIHTFLYRKGPNQIRPTERKSA